MPGMIPELGVGLHDTSAQSTPPASPTASSGSETMQDEFYDLHNTQEMLSDAADAEAQAPWQPTSSYADLPHEILLHVFRYVMGSQQDLQACLLVCRRWCVCGVQLLWHRPSFHKLSSLFKLIHVMIQPDASFPYASYVRRLNFSLLAGDLDDQLFGRMDLCHRLERLTLAGCSQVTDATLARVLSQTPQLVAVDLSGVVQLTDATLHVLAKHCTRLQGANLSGCKQVTSDGVVQLAQQCRSLRRIKLGTCEDIDGRAFVQLIRCCPILLEADFVGCPRIQDTSVREVWLQPTLLRELKLAHCVALTDRAFPTPALLEDLQRNPPVAELGSAPTLLANPRVFPVCEQLRILDLTNCVHLTDETVRGIVAQAPKLRNLSLAKCAQLTDESVYAISKLGRNLQYLHLAHITHLTDRAIIHLAHHCTRIRYLDLACCVLLTDASVVVLAANLPKLRRIGLVRVANLTDAAIYSLVERYMSLERIHLSYCENISVPAVFWLTQRLSRLTHLSLTGVPAFRHNELQSMCRPPPKEFNQHQRQSFCVYSGRGVGELRRYLARVYSDETLAAQFGALHPDIQRALESSIAQRK
ncbi:SCF ubiquitin ligase complex subunit [Malassezia japonica]|uniref:SCF ubiquitin ligase complex subunit n=1 Tax=Malassezia japonica TaxID=223818 RepID=A0AAF0F2E0_9BASI|nr:SCF ubiquitin ligase complex subunit [Malassezia japonica]WFD38809.1 SCF ubiquitin ligase complex subunit [Malassezia japonica]